MSEKKTIAIIGAGIVGVSAAVWLQRDGHEVILIDKAGPGEGTSHGNGGVLASCSVVPVTVPGLLGKAPRMLFDRSQPLFMKWGYIPKLLPWLLRYLKHANTDDVNHIAAALTPIVGDSLNDHQALAQGTGAEKWITPSDYLFLYENRQHFEGDAFGWDIRRKNGFTWDELEGQAFHDYDPVFSKDISFAARLGDHGHIRDPGRYVKDLAAHVEANGGRIIQAAVDDVARENGKVTGVRAGGHTIACDTAIVTAGVWSGPLARKLGVAVPLESERGYHLELVEPSAMPKSPVMVASGKFVATPMEGRIRLAGIVEFGGLDAPPSRAPFELLRKNAQSVLPGITWKDEVEWMGHRPAPVDSIPVIGEVPGAEGAYMGFGHHHIGLTGGPKTGRLLAQMIAGRTPNTDMTVYAPSRYKT
ncbi:NAD(P)/FAD-dependent oxidoreductase [Ruegeria meonggei]|uniref:D-amino acid dehydrogenase small subunit n=1 Tax=Ruegeria meonggei TaxID=1446476 RepID=A0A1X6Y6P4_9RHOB|nr:FAD-binding oxidoreductase [Ruegeria meonggei]SLN10537.1 D-amino acid dehydrogenase small subunit [Ruegeria meonggei]